MSVEAVAPKKRNRSLNGDDVRRMCTAIAGGLVLAIMTGPDGAISEPTYGVKSSLFSGHVVGYLIIGVVIGCLLTYRAKVKDGTWRRVRNTPKRTLIERATSISSISRGALLAVTALVVAIVTLVFADFSGPVAPNKLSIHELIHQFLYTRTYGYLILALALWFAVVNQAVPLTTFRLRSIPRPLFVLGAIISILLFALTSDPFLPPRFSWRALNPGVANSLFHHWTTYLWLILGLAIVVSWMFKRDPGPGARPTRRAHALVVTPSMRYLTYVAAGFVVFEAPKFMSQYWQISLFQQIGVFCLLAIGLNIVVGFAGLLDLGYVAFYALGAYVTAYFSGALPIHPPFHLNPFLIIPFAIVIAMLAGVLLGLPTLRLRGDYLAIVTLGFGEIVYVLANDWTQATAGSAGTGAITNFSVHLFGIHYTWNAGNPLSYYYLLLGILIPAIFLFDLLNHSKVGRTWAAIREDEVAAQSLGINALKYKVMAFAMGASTAGVAGVFTAVKVGVLFPNTFVLQLSISILVLVIFGGMGSIVGVLFGAIVLQWLPSYLNFHSYLGFQEADLYLYIGALLIVMMIFRPQGLVPSRRRRREILDSEVGLGSADALGPITTEQPS
jgi:branched-chain amino acid transport system permease protein